MPKLDIRIGVKEIVAVAVSIPLVYERLRRIKLKYDKKEEKVVREIRDDTGMLVPGDILFDVDGNQWTVTG